MYYHLLRCSANIFSCTCTNPGYCSYFKHDCTNTSVTAYYPTVPAPPSNPNHYPLYHLATLLTIPLHHLAMQLFHSVSCQMLLLPLVLT